MNRINRKNFMTSLLLTLGLATIPASNVLAIEKIKLTEPPKAKIGLNCYSFNQPLIAKTMTVEEMFRISASAGFEAVDLTGYYFSTYPAVPSDEEIYRYKKCAFLLGLDISGTGGAQ